MRAPGFLLTMVGLAASGTVLAFLAIADPGVVHGSPAASSASKAVTPQPSDALVLATRMAPGVWPARSTVAELEVLLPRVRMLHPMFDSVSARPDFDLHWLSVKADEKVAPRWQRGQLRVGDRLLDSLGSALGLVEAKAYFPPSGSDELGKWCLLRFAHALNMEAVAAGYRRSPAVLSAGPDHFIGDGNNLWAIKTEKGWEFVFSRGWGDCPAGCTGRRSLFVAVDSSGRALVGPTWPPPGGPEGPVNRPWIPSRINR